MAHISRPQWRRPHAEDIDDLNRFTEARVSAIEQFCQERGLTFEEAVSELSLVVDTVLDETASYVRVRTDRGRLTWRVEDHEMAFLRDSMVLVHYRHRGRTPSSHGQPGQGAISQVLTSLRCPSPGVVSSAVLEQWMGLFPGVERAQSLLSLLEQLQSDATRVESLEVSGDVLLLKVDGRVWAVATDDGTVLSLGPTGRNTVAHETTERLQQVLDAGGPRVSQKLAQYLEAEWEAPADHIVPRVHGVLSELLTSPSLRVYKRRSADRPSMTCLEDNQYYVALSRDCEVVLRLRATTT